jgi:hypothetical protein
MLVHSVLRISRSSAARMIHGSVSRKKTPVMMFSTLKSAPKSPEYLTLSLVTATIAAWALTKSSQLEVCDHGRTRLDTSSALHFLSHVTYHDFYMFTTKGTREQNLLLTFEP